MGFENDMLFLSDHAQTKQGNDTIFSCYARYLNAVEAGADAVNGTIGALLLDDGMLAMNTVVIEEIKQAEMIEIAAYAPLKGVVEFLDLSTSLALGESRTMLKEKGLSTTSIATPGGSGALYVAAKCFLNPGESILLRDRYWGPYAGFIDGCGLGVETYPLLPSVQNEDHPFFDLDSFSNKLLSLATSQQHVMTWLNDPAHNPTGLSLPPESRASLLDEFMRSASVHPNVGHTLLIDTAYHYYADEPHGWSDTIAEVIDAGFTWPENLLICFALSLSKSHTIYGMRNGALICLHPDTDVTARLNEVLGVTGRQTWSASPRVSQQALCSLHSDAEKSKRWNNQLHQFHTILAERRSTFVQKCQELNVPINPTHDGFFAWIESEHAAEIVEQCANEHVYLVPLKGGIRIGLCAIPTTQITRVAEVLSRALSNTM